MDCRTRLSDEPQFACCCEVVEVSRCEKVLTRYQCDVHGNANSLDPRVQQRLGQFR